MALMAVLLGVALILGAILGLLLLGGQRNLVLAPVALFVLIDVAATMPPLLPDSESVLVSKDGFALILAATALLTFTFAYFLGGGGCTEEERWRDDDATPSVTWCQHVKVGIVVLTTLLMGISIWRFAGLPPMLTGGFSSLLDPVGHADQVAVIRDARKSMTKGATLLGENYAGQGILNAFVESGWRVVLISAVFVWSWQRTRSSLVLLISVSVLAFLFLGSGGERGPIVFAAIAVVAALTLRFRPSPRAILVGVAVVVGLIMFVMPLSKGDRGGTGLSDRLDAAWIRVTDGNGRHNAQIVNLVESGQMELGYGSIFMEKATAVLPGPVTEPFALRLTQSAYGSQTSKTAYSTPTQYGVLYADGGPVGVVLGYLLSGTFIGLAWRRLCRYTSPFGAIGMASFAVILGMISITGLPGAVASAAVTLLAIGFVAMPGYFSGLRHPQVSSSRRHHADTFESR